VIVRFGKPFLLDGDSHNDRSAVVNGTKRIMREIAALLPPEMRGVWADEVASPEVAALPEEAVSVR
jgi:hypothetical protein